MALLKFFAVPGSLPFLALNLAIGFSLVRFTRRFRRLGRVWVASTCVLYVVLALPIGFFVTKKLKLSHLPEILYRSALMSGVVAALIAFAATVTFLLTVDLLPQQLVAWMKSITTDKTMFLLLVAVMLLVVGMFLESNAAYIMLVPLFHPIALAYGIDPTLFAFLFVLNLIIGMMTPPVGVVLFVIQGMTGIKMGELVRQCLPFIVSQSGGNDGLDHDREVSVRP